MDLGPIFPFTSGPSQQIDDAVACDYCDQAAPKRDSRERCRNCGAPKPTPKPCLPGKRNVLPLVGIIQ